MKLSQNQTSADGFQGFQAFVNTWHDNPASPPCAANADQICRTPLPPGAPVRKNLSDQYWNHLGCFLPTVCYQYEQAYGPNLHSGFVYWQGPDPSVGFLYALPEKEFLRAFRYRRGTRHVELEQPFMTNRNVRVPRGMPGGALSLSANANQDGILWVSVHDNDATSEVQPGHLIALEATTLRELWREDDIKFFAKFVPPTIAEGKVFLAAWGKPATPYLQATSTLIAYGLRH